MLVESKQKQGRKYFMEKSEAKLSNGNTYHPASEPQFCQNINTLSRFLFKGFNTQDGHNSWSILVTGILVSRKGSLLRYQDRLSCSRVPSSFHCALPWISSQTRQKLQIKLISTAFMRLFSVSAFWDSTKEWVPPEGSPSSTVSIGRLLSRFLSMKMLTKAFLDEESKQVSIHCGFSSVSKF